MGTEPVRGARHPQRARGGRRPSRRAVRRRAARPRCWRSTATATAPRARRGRPRAVPAGPAGPGRRHGLPHRAGRVAGRAGHRRSTPRWPSRSRSEFAMYCERLGMARDGTASSSALEDPTLLSYVVTASMLLHLSERQSLLAAPRRRPAAAPRAEPAAARAGAVAGRAVGAGRRPGPPLTRPGLAPSRPARAVRRAEQRGEAAGDREEQRTDEQHAGRVQLQRRPQGLWCARPAGGAASPGRAAGRPARRRPRRCPRR